MSQKKRSSIWQTLKSLIPSIILLLKELLCQICRTESSESSMKNDSETSESASDQTESSDTNNDEIIEDGKISNSEVLFVLDPGHGYDTLGKGFGKYEEWEFNRWIVERVEHLLPMKIKRAKTVRDWEMYDVPLRRRTDRINKMEGRKVVVSFHSNAFDDHSVKGARSYYYDESSRWIAEIFQKNLAEWFIDGGVKYGNFHIIRESEAFGVLLEAGFHTNPEDRKLLMDLNFREEIAKCYVKSIEEIWQRLTQS
jgi:N-acetylmuramoyl-L-alanine amidase